MRCSISRLPHPESKACRERNAADPEKGSKLFAFSNDDDGLCKYFTYCPWCFEQIGKGWQGLYDHMESECEERGKYEGKPILGSGRVVAE